MLSGTKNWFSLSKELVERELIIAQGYWRTKITIPKQSFNIVGGTHHAYSTHGELLFAQ
jgi:hypothetical protein